MDGRVQIVDQLRADGGLCERQFKRGERVACIAVKHCKECVVLLGWLKAFLFNGRYATFCQARYRSRGATQVFADLSSGLAASVTGKPLRRIGQHELVAFLDGVAVFREISQHRLTPRS